MISCNKCLQVFCKTNSRKLGKCNHAFCCECLVKYLKTIDNPMVKCMIPQCNGVIPDNIIRECLSDDQIKAYEKLCASSRKTIDDSAMEARARQALKEKRRRDFVELNKKFLIFPNPSSFRCPICEEFFLPRTGLILRNCLHCFCKDCLKEAILSKGFISQRRCPLDECYRELDDGELYALDPEGHVGMVEREASGRFYQCKSVDCTGMWDATKRISTYRCPKCSKINCLECEDIHDGQSCGEFRETRGYLEKIKINDKIMRNQCHVKCYVCTKQLIRQCGSNAIFCDGCGGQTCLFTGKIPGEHDPVKCRCKGALNCANLGEYCGCTSRAPCDRLCRYGCIPEYHR